MKIYRLLYVLAFSLLLTLNVGCGGNGNDEVEEGYEKDDYYSEEDGYEDGTYCATVTYYNPNTGTRSDYTLEVEVESNELVKIYWPNGGWLDEDHFSAQELDEDGYCSFTSDKGYEYSIQITGTDCAFTDDSRFQNDVEEDQEEEKEEITCPKCGDKKYQYDDYCDHCRRKLEDETENTCSKCGGFEYGVYGGLCNNCEEDEEE